MPRFFFDFRQAGEHTADTIGTELPSVEQAYLEVFKASQEMWSELLKQRRDPRRCFFEVRGHDSDLLFVFPLQEVVDCCLDRKQPSMQHTFKQLTNTYNYARRVRDEFAREVQRTQNVLQDSHNLLKKQSSFSEPRHPGACSSLAVPAAAGPRAPYASPGFPRKP